MCLIFIQILFIECHFVWCQKDDLSLFSLTSSLAFNITTEFNFVSQYFLCSPQQNFYDFPLVSLHSVLLLSENLLIHGNIPSTVSNCLLMFFFWVFHLCVSERFVQYLAFRIHSYLNVIISSICAEMIIFSFFLFCALSRFHMNKFFCSAFHWRGKFSANVSRQYARQMSVSLLVKISAWL